MSKYIVKNWVMVRGNTPSQWKRRELLADLGDTVTNRFACRGDLDSKQVGVWNEVRQLTGAEWVQELPMRIQVLINPEDIDLDREHLSLAHFIMDGFNWHKAPEGYDFWTQVHKACKGFVDWPEAPKKVERCEVPKKVERCENCRYCAITGPSHSKEYLCTEHEEYCDSKTLERGCSFYSKRYRSKTVV